MLAFQVVLTLFRQRLTF